MSILSLALTFFSLTSVTQATLSKTALYSDGLGGHYQYGSKLPFPGGSYYGVTLPQKCADYAASKHDDGSLYCSAANMQAVNVTYSDCSLPYTVCYCNESKGIHMSLNDLLVQWGRVPNTLRDYTRFLLSFPDSGNHAVTWLPINDILLFGDESSESGVSVIVHEAGHTVDQSFSTSSTFKNAINADTCCPDAYALTNEVEDFAQITVCSLYYYLFGAYPSGPSVSCMSNQLNAFQSNSRLVKSVMLKSSCDLSIRGSHNHLKRDSHGKPAGRWFHYHSKYSKTDLESGKVVRRPFQPTPVIEGVEMEIVAPSFVDFDNVAKFAGARVAAVEAEANPTPTAAEDGVFWVVPTDSA